MNLIRKIKNCKRHKQNKTLSMFAEAIFNMSWKAPEFDMFIHPLIFEIIRFNHFGEMCSKLRPSELIDNPFSYVLETEPLWKLPRSFSWEEQEKLNNIPLSVFAQPELYLRIDKPIPPEPSVSIKEI